MKFGIKTINLTDVEIEVAGTDKIVFLGSNGAGKSRLGHFIENSVFHKTHTGNQQIQSELVKCKRSHEELCKQVSGILHTISELYKETDINQLDILLSRIFNKDAVVYKGYKNDDVQAFKQTAINSISSSMFEIEERKIIFSNEIKKKEKEIQDFEKEKNSYFKFCQRISGHRSLIVDGVIPQESCDKLHQSLLYGDTFNNSNTFQKWKVEKRTINSNGVVNISHENKGVGILQNDFGMLMGTLIAEELEIGAKIKQQRIPVDSRSTLDKIITVWNNLLMHKKLMIEVNKIKIMCNNGVSYELIDGSEGERTVFYILGQCLLSEEKSLIIIDEPELHIHKSIINSLYDAIESAMEDCAFIYITHDLDFAGSRTGDKYAVIDYSPAPAMAGEAGDGRWNIEKLLESDDIPEKYWIKICGSRKNILFIEGDSCSLDVIYNYVYGDFTIISLGSCHEVEKYTKILNQNKQFHRVKFFGLIDKDGKSDADIEKLKRYNVYCLDVANIENIFAIPNVAEYIYSLLHETFEKENFIKDIIKHIKDDLNWQVKNIKDSLYKSMQKKINKLPNNIDEINGLDDFNLSINEVVEDKKSKFGEILSIGENETCLRKLLSIFRNKSILNKMASGLGVGGQKALERKILTCCTNDKELIALLRKELPVIEI